MFGHSCTCNYETTNSRNRKGILSQFNVVRTSLIDNTTTPLQVGNGNFAFNVDNTGMQVRTWRLGFLPLQDSWAKLNIRVSYLSILYQAGDGTTTPCQPMGESSTLTALSPSLIMAEIGAERS